MHVQRLGVKSEHETAPNIYLGTYFEATQARLAIKMLRDLSLMGEKTLLGDNSVQEGEGYTNWGGEFSRQGRNRG